MKHDGKEKERLQEEVSQVQEDKAKDKKAKDVHNKSKKEMHATKDIANYKKGQNRNKKDNEKKSNKKTKKKEVNFMVEDFGKKLISLKKKLAAQDYQSALERSKIELEINDLITKQYNARPKSRSSVKMKKTKGVKSVAGKVKKKGAKKTAKKTTTKRKTTKKKK